MNLKLYNDIDSFNKEVDGAVWDYKRKRRKNADIVAFEKVFAKLRTRFRTKIRKTADTRRDFSSSSNGIESFREFKAGWELAVQLSSVEVFYAVLDRDVVMFWKPETIKSIEEITKSFRDELKNIRNDEIVFEVQDS